MPKTIKRPTQPMTADEFVILWGGEVCKHKKAADILGVSPRTVYDMCRDGRLQYAPNSNGRVSVRSIHALLYPPPSAKLRVASR